MGYKPLVRTIEKEIADWVSQDNIKVNQLLTNSIKDFHKNGKATSIKRRT